MKAQAGSYPTVDRSEGHTCFRDWEGGRNIMTIVQKWKKSCTVQVEGIKCAL